MNSVEEDGPLTFTLLEHVQHLVQRHRFINHRKSSQIDILDAHTILGINHDQGFHQNHANDIVLVVLVDGPATVTFTNQLQHTDPLELNLFHES